MPQMVFRVIGLQIEPNRRGDEMRRLTLRAVDGDAFVSEQNSVEPVGDCSVLVTAAYIKAKKLALGDTVTLDIQEQ